MRASFQVRLFRAASRVLRELRCQNSEEQYEQDGAQNDSMFVHGGFSFRLAGKRTLSILISSWSGARFPLDAVGTIITEEKELLLALKGLSP